MFQYLMKLHYSQTKRILQRHNEVSVPYEITLLSNEVNAYAVTDNVSVPYEITLLSNKALL